MKTMTKKVRFAEKIEERYYILDEFERDSKRLQWTIIKSQIPLIMMLLKIRKETNIPETYL